jgi:hypothetical protein
MSGDRLVRSGARVKSSPHQAIASACSPASTSATSARLGGESRRAARSRRQSRRGRRRRNQQEPRLRTRKADGTLLAASTIPSLDPVWDAAGRLNIPVFIHTAEPQEFFEPIDNTTRTLPRALAVSRSPLPGRPVPALRRADCRSATTSVKKHPKTRFVAAHLGWHGNDLGGSANATRRDAQRLRRTRRRSLRPWPPAAPGGHRFPRQVSGPRVMFGKVAVRAASEYPY